MKLFLFIGIITSLILTIFSNHVWRLEYIIYSCNGIDFSFIIYIDSLASLFLITIFIISYSVFTYSEGYIKDHCGRFNKLLLLFVMSILLMVLSPNLLSILIGWDILGLISFCLVVYYQSNSSYKAGIITILINRVGDVALLMCLPLIVGLWGTLTHNSMFIIDILLVIAACTKSAQLPFSAWLPAAIAAPTPVSALVHSSTLVTAGIYLLIRYNWAIENINKYLIIIGLITILIAGFNAIQEIDIKKVVALSTLSQLGFIRFGLSIGAVDLIYFHMLTHAFFKALIFLAVGIVIHNINQDFRFVGLVYSPITIIALIVSIISLIGFPFIIGFYSKDLILEITITVTETIFIISIFILGIIFTMRYSLRLLNLITSLIYLGVPLTKFNESNSIIKGLIILILCSVLLGGRIQWRLPLTFCFTNNKWMMLLIFFIIFIPWCNFPLMNLDQISTIFKLIIMQDEPAMEPQNWIPQWFEGQHVYSSLSLILWILFVFW